MTSRVRADNLPFPPSPGRFACASIDWPSHFETRAPVSNPSADRSPQRHYPTADVEHMETLDVRSFLTPDAFVFLWMTGPHLAIGTHVRFARAWGLKLSALAFVWIKTKRSFDMAALQRSPLLDCDLHHGLGYSTLANAEYVVLLRHGKPKRLRAVRQVIIAPVDDHSRKPIEFFRRCEIFCAGPRIDMFAGRPVPGWTKWGLAHRVGDRSAA